MQRSVGSIRVTHRGTRFVSPAGTRRGSRLLARGHTRVTPGTPRAVRLAAQREPVAAVRRSARSLSTRCPADGQAGRALLRAGSWHWSSPRRALRDPRSFRAVARHH